MLCAEPIRIATYAVSLTRQGPGLLLRDIGKDDDAQIAATIRIICAVSPDVLVLTSFDYDADGVALAAYADRLAASCPRYDHLYAPHPNTGRQVGWDLDQDGRLGEPEDAVGYGWFSGEGGIAILSRFPIDQGGVQSLTDLPWAKVPGAPMPRDFWDDAIGANLPASSTAHVIVPIHGPLGVINILAHSGTPPIFDGEENQNGLRGGAEVRVWSALITGQLDLPSPPAFVLAAKTNIDPWDGEGDHAAMAALLSHPKVQDPEPQSLGAAMDADAGHTGPAALDTATWPSEAPGNLRVSYVLPSTDWQVLTSGVYWPRPGLDPGVDADLDAAGPHRLVWVDLKRRQTSP